MDTSRFTTLNVRRIASNAIAVNAMLIHIQMKGAKYVATATRWNRDYGRRIKVGARPIVILQPMGPVMFVFDVTDTDGNTQCINLEEADERDTCAACGREFDEDESIIEAPTGKTYCRECFEQGQG